MFILARVKDGIVDDVIVAPEIPVGTDGYVFIDVTDKDGGPQLLGQTAAQVSGGQSLSITIEEPVVETPVEEVVVAEEVAIVEDVVVETPVVETPVEGE